MTSATLTSAPGSDGTVNRLGRTPQNASDAETLRPSLRELRLISERLLQAQGLALGAVPAVRDLVLHAQAAGLPALQFLSEGLSAADRAGSGRVEIAAEAPGALVVHCMGQSALVVAPALLDLLRPNPGSGSPCGRGASSTPASPPYWSTRAPTAAWPHRDARPLGRRTRPPVCPRCPTAWPGPA
ncbi:hypothetical protein STENM36S_05080 [Streptomyces tendae]